MNSAVYILPNALYIKTLLKKPALPALTSYSFSTKHYKPYLKTDIWKYINIPTT
jgi:hypothetical protein